MRYSYTFSGLLTAAMSSVVFAQSTPVPTTDATSATSGGLNVPTSVTTFTVEPVTTTLTTVAKPTSTVSPEICCIECTTVYDECCAVPGADITVCKEAYTVCLGYNPFDIVPWVQPSVCKFDVPKHGGKNWGYYTPEVCCLECTSVYEECCSVDGADIEVCKASYTTCLGYNPYDSHIFTVPTTCKHEESYYIEYESKHGEYFKEKYGHYESSHYESSSYSKHEGYYTAEYCCLECTTIYDECCKVPGADIEICKKEYTVCLGYNPFEIIPWVEPTVCKHDEKYYKEYESKHEYNSKYDKDYKHGEKSGDYSKTIISDEECCIQCKTVYDDCCKVPGADIEICKTEYTVCLGYNPFEVVPWVEPTVCKHGDNKQGGSSKSGDHSKTGGDHSKTGGDHSKTGGDHSKTGGDSKSGDHSKVSVEEECCIQCKTVYDECCSIEGHDIEVCKTEYTVCLGYNPFEVVPWVEPTVCKHGDSSKTDGKTDKTGSSSDKTYGHGDKTDGSHKSQGGKTDEECAVECTTVYKACCDASGAIIETCKTAYATCLGYNPYDITPFVEPTVCKHGKPSDDEVVIVNGGDRVRPALALFALGVFALL